MLRSEIPFYRRILSAALGVALYVLLAFSSQPGYKNFSETRFYDTIEYALHDQWYHLRGIEKPTAPIVILAMDQQSYRLLGIPSASPWPRSLHAAMLQKLAQAGVIRAVMDIVFADPRVPTDDERFLASLGALPVVLGVDTGFQERSIGGSEYTIRERIDPWPPFVQKAEATALVKLPIEGDIIRHLYLPRDDLTHSTPILYEAALGPDYQGQQPLIQDLIRYYGPAGTIPTISYHTVLDTPVDQLRTLLSGKIVFVGLDLRTGVGAMEKDSYLTPYDHAPMFGVEIQATAAANLWERSWIHRLSPSQELWWTAVLLGVSVLIFQSVSLAVGLLTVAVITLLWVVASYACFCCYFFLPGATSVVVLSLMGISDGLFRGMAHYAARQRIERAFSPFFPKEVRRLIEANQQEELLQGKQQYVTVLFSDIAGFTTIAETMEPALVRQMLNAYFDKVENAIFQNQGALIKFIGDAAFVLYGAPLADPRHQEHATLSAIDLLKAVETLNQIKLFPHLKTRIGIHSGWVVTGGLGSQRRNDYTAIGDTVNVASRIEGINKYFGTTILLSQTVADALPPSFCLIPIASVVVKGKVHAVQLYSVMQPDVTEDQRSEWISALQLFKEGKLTDASSIFERIEHSNTPLSQAARYYRSVISNTENQVDPETWTGAISFDDK